MKPIYKKMLLGFLVGFFAGWLIAYYQVQQMDPEMIQQILEQTGSLNVVVLIGAFQSGILTALATALGSRLAPGLGLSRPFILERGSLVAAILVGFLSSLFITIPERFYFAQRIGYGDEPFILDPLYLISALLYGGVVEELLLRYGVMTLLVFLGAKVWRKYGKTANSAESGSQLPPDSIYIFGIVVASLLFAAGHLPANAQLFGLTPVTVARAMLLNFFPGVGFGYLYWKYSLGYAMIAHALVHVFNQLILLPILF